MNPENEQDLQGFKDESKLVNYWSYQEPRNDCQEWAQHINHHWPGLCVGVGQQDVDDELAEACEGRQHDQGQALSERV